MARRAARPRPGGARTWTAVFAAAGAVVGALPALAAAPGASPSSAASLAGTPSLGAAVGPALARARCSRSRSRYLTYAALVVAGVRVLGRSLREGYHPVRSGAGVRAWTTERLMDAARTGLFPLYSSGATPAWLRLLGAQVGRGTEISTVIGLPTHDAHPRRRLPRGRHDGRRVRAGRRLAAGRVGEGRPARLPRQLRDHRARPDRAEERARRGAVRRAGPGPVRRELPRQPAGPAGPVARGRRRRPDLRVHPRPAPRPGRGRGLPGGPRAGPRAAVGRASGCRC